MAYKVGRKGGIFGCGLMLLLLLFAPLGCIAGGPYTEAAPRPFNAARWKAADTWGDTRCAMIADLMFRKGLEGRTREEVTALLGAPEADNRDPGLSHWHLCPSMVDVWIIEVRWKKDRVARAWVRDT